MKNKQTMNINKQNKQYKRQIQTSLLTCTKYEILMITKRKKSILNDLSEPEQRKETITKKFVRFLNVKMCVRESNKQDETNKMTEYLI